MILNVSGRTDIVAFYSEWFKKRYEAGFVDVRNPINPKLVSRISFSDVDLILFCTKNPHSIIDYLEKIKQPIIFHVTLTPYKKEIEPGVYKKGVIEDIKRISNILGKDRIIVRYDPIFVSDNYPLEYHFRALEKICTELEGYIEKIIVSFLDDYKNVRKNRDVLQFKILKEKDYEEIGINFAHIAARHNMTIQTCSEYNNLSKYGFQVGDCLDSDLAYKLTNKKYPKWKARQNNNCNCVAMVDIGAYNSCGHFCKYCYANFCEEKIKENIKIHNPNSTLLIGELKSDDVIKPRKS